MGMDGKTSGGPEDIAPLVFAARVAADFLAALATPVLEVSANVMAKVTDAMVTILLEFDGVRRSLMLSFSVTPLVDK